MKSDVEVNKILPVSLKRLDNIKMEFDCKLAHSYEIKKISGFRSNKELFVKISDTFSMPISEVSISSHK